jgi:hypothetical protein
VVKHNDLQETWHDLDRHQFREIGEKNLCPKFYSLHREYVLDTSIESIAPELRLGETPLDFLRLS